MDRSVRRKTVGVGARAHANPGLPGLSGPSGHSDLSRIAQQVNRQHGSMPLRACVSLLTLASALAVAQEAPKSDGEADAAKSESAKKADAAVQLNTVVVTAQKRKQSVLDIAAAVSVISDATIAENNIQGIKDFFGLVPNVNAQEGGSGGARTVLISMRGINDQGAGGERVAAVSAFGFYVDEFSVGNAATDTANPPLYDIESIEVLRGPQGTYFGRNASGGVINIQSKKPGKKFFGQVDFGLGSFNAVHANGVVNVPLSENLFLRQSIQSQRDSGAVRNMHRTGGDSGVKLASSRTGLRWLPTKDTTVDLSLSVTREDQGNAPRTPTGIAPNFGFQVPVDAARNGDVGFWPANQSRAYYNSPVHVKNESAIANARVEQRFDTFSLTALAGFTRGTSEGYNDLDGAALDVVDRASTFRAKSSSLEVRLASLGKNTIDWIVGGYAYNDKNDYDNAIHIKGVAFGWVPGDIANENRIHIRRSGSALFADATWNATPSTSLSIGGRYSKDKDRQFWTDVFGANGALSLKNDDKGVMVPGATYYPSGTDWLRSGGKKAQVIGTDGTNSGNDFSPRIAVNYKLRPDLSLYGTISQGYKSGGVRVNPDGDVENVSKYKKEKVTNTEVGFKGLFFGNTRIEGALFNMDWKDFQVPFRQTFCTMPDGSLKLDDGTVTPCNKPVPLDKIINAKKARTRGLELAVTSQVTDALKLGGTLGLLNAKYVDYKTAQTSDGPGDASGSPIPAAPKRTATLFAQWDGAVGNGEFYLRPEISYRSRFYNTVLKSGAADPDQSIPRYFGTIINGRSLLNLRAGYSVGKVNLSLSAENLTNKAYFTSVTGSISGRKVDVHPRTFMAKVSVTTD